MRLYVGNLPFTVIESELREHFARFGSIVSAMVSTDRDTGRPRGFGSVEFAKAEDGRRAIENTNGKPLGGRALKVNESQPKESRDGRFGASGGYWKD